MSKTKTKTKLKASAMGHNEKFRSLKRVVLLNFFLTDSDIIVKFFLLWISLAFYAKKNLILIVKVLCNQGESVKKGMSFISLHIH